MMVLGSWSRLASHAGVTRGFIRLDYFVVVRGFKMRSSFGRIRRRAVRRGIVILASAMWGRSTDGIDPGLIYEEMGHCNLFRRAACAGSGK